MLWVYCFWTVLYNDKYEYSIYNSNEDILNKHTQSQLRLWHVMICSCKLCKLCQECLLACNACDSLKQGGHKPGILRDFSKRWIVVHSADGSAASASSVTSAVHGEATVAEAFLRMFVETCGHYDANISTQGNGEKIFQVHIAVMYSATRAIALLRWWQQLIQLKVDFIDINFSVGTG